VRREIRCDPEVLADAINDGINVFIHDVLVPRGLIDNDRYFGGGLEEKELLQLKYEVAQKVAGWWKVSWREEEG